MRESMNIPEPIISLTFTATTALIRDLELVSAFPARTAPQRKLPAERLAVRARLDRPSKAPHLRQALRRSRQGHLPSESHQPAERRRLRVRLQRSLTLPHHGGNAKALPRALRRETSGAQETDKEKQNLRATEPEKIAALEPDQRKQNLRVAVLNFRENPLLGQPGNLHLKQQIPVKEPRKGHKQGLTGNQRGAKPTHLRPRVRNKRTQSVS